MCGVDRRGRVEKGTIEVEAIARVSRLGHLARKRDSGKRILIGRKDIWIRDAQSM